MDAFRIELDAEMQSILAANFRVIITPTSVVPGIDDPEITHPNLDSREQKCKLLESCILHVDIRDSTVIGDQHRRETLVRLYSGFVRAMSRCAGHYNGRVRNIIGDRVMVLFDKQNCFSNAINTAILMNSVAKYMIDKYFTLNTIRCGIGIDYGPMLIAKAGVIKRGIDTPASRSLVWLGRPANVASKLADEANKKISWTTPTVRETYFYPAIGEFLWSDVPVSEFLDKLGRTYSPVIRHPNQYFFAFHESVRNHSRNMPPILMTDAVVKGLKLFNPADSSLKQNLWKKQSLKVSGYDGSVFGGDVVFPAIQKK